MEKQSIATTVLCPQHPTEHIQRVDDDMHTSHHLYCLECILQQQESGNLPSTLKTLPDFINTAASLYLQKKDTLTPLLEAPLQYLAQLSKQSEILDAFRKHIEEQKKEVETTFDKISQDILGLLAERKQECLNTLDQQLFPMRYWYIFFDRQVKKTYPTPEDISYLFPSKEDLAQKLEKIDNITQLRAFVRTIKEEIYESMLERRDGQSIQRRDQENRLAELSARLNEIEVTKPSFIEEKFQLERIQTDIKMFLDRLLTEKIALKNPIQEVT